MEVDGKTVMRAPDGGLFQVDPAQAEQRAQDLGWTVAPDEAVQEQAAKREQYTEHGSTAQQALGLAETFVRNATLGQVPGLTSDTPDETRARAEVVGEESPILNAVAGAAPAVAASLATGGAGLGIAGTAAAEGLIGGLSSVGAAADEAFRHDQELSAEAALGSFGGGFLLGGAAGGAAAYASKAIPKAIGAARNRFLEASGKLARKAEAEAFEAAGVVRPVKGLAEAVDDPVKAAKLRQAGKKARPVAQQKLATELETLDNAEQAARQFSPEVAEVSGDVAAQRGAIREVLDGARKELEPIATGAEKGTVSRLFENLDRAATPDEIYAVARSARAALADTLDASADPAVAKVLSKYADKAKAVEADAALFGSPADDAASHGQALADLGEARQALTESLGGGNYLDTVGTKDGVAIDQAMDTYLERLGTVLSSSDAPAAKDGLAAIGRIRALRDGDFAAVAGGNQADALKQFGGKKPAPSMARDIAGEVAETAVESLVPGAGLVRKAWKYRKHIARLAGGARQDAGVAADRLLSTSLTTVGKGSRAFTRAASPLGARAAMFADLGGKPEEQYDRVRNVVQTLAREPDRLAEALSTQMGDIPSESPELLEAVNAKAQRAVEFLAAKLPPAFEFSLTYPDGPPPSRTDIMELSLYWRGVTQPREVLEAIGDGSAMPEEVEAFRAVNPTWFVELQEACQDRIVEKNQTGQVIPAFRIAQLETLLDLPGKLDPTFSDSIAAVAQLTTAAKQQQQQQNSTYAPAPKAGERTKPASLERIKS